MSDLVTWRPLITREMAVHQDSPENIESAVPAWGSSAWDTQFDSGYGGSEGCPFTVWTSTRVYFPGVYDGAEWVASVSRHPDMPPTQHIGGQ